MFKLKRDGKGVGVGSSAKGRKKKSFLNIVENYFLWTVLRVDILCWSSLIITSAIYNQNTQWASSDQLICWLWPQPSYASCLMCVCVCCCHLRLGWLGAGPWQGWGEPLRGWGDRTHAHVPSLFDIHIYSVLFCIQAEHPLNKPNWKCT